MTTPLDRGPAGRTRGGPGRAQPYPSMAAQAPHTLNQYAAALARTPSSKSREGIASASKPRQTLPRPNGANSSPAAADS